MLSGRRSASRGQALFETAAMMPLFLLGFFGIFFAVRQSAMSERVQFGVRYGGEINALVNPYLSYSLYNVYTTIDGAPPTDADKNCGNAQANQLTVARASFWQPVGTPSAFCSGRVSPIQVGGPNGYILLQNDFVGLGTTVPVDGYLSKIIKNSTMPTTASGNFFRSPDIGEVLSCSSLGAPIKLSLEGYNDSSLPIAPTAMPINVPATPLITAPVVCASFGPATSNPVPPIDD